MITKQCSKCKEIKELAEFNRDKTKTLGVSSQCKKCAKATSNLHYRANSEHRSRNITSYSHEHISAEERKVLSRLRVLCTKAHNRDKWDHDLTYDYLKGIWDGQKGLCAYSGLPLSLEANQFNTTSLDRINSQIGYLKGNVQLVCAMVNHMKLHYKEDQFLSMCHTIADNTRDKITLEGEPLGRDYFTGTTS